MAAIRRIAHLETKRLQEEGEESEIKRGITVSKLLPLTMACTDNAQGLKFKGLFKLIKIFACIMIEFLQRKSLSFGFIL